VTVAKERVLAKGDSGIYIYIERERDRERGEGEREYIYTSIYAY
jgi:hypothetical protein